MGSCCSCGKNETSNEDRYNNFGLLTYDPSDLIAEFEKQQLVSLEEALAPFQGKIKNLSTKIKHAKDNCNPTTKDHLSRDESAAIYIYSDGTDKNSIFTNLKDALDSNDRERIRLWYKYLKLLYAAVKKCPNAKKETWQGIPSAKSTEDKLRTKSNSLYTGFGSAAPSRDGVQEHLKQKNVSKITYLAYGPGMAKNVSDYTVDGRGETMLIPGLHVAVAPSVDQLSDGSIIYHLVNNKKATIARPTPVPPPPSSSSDLRHFVCQNPLCNNRCHTNHDSQHCVGFYPIHSECNHHCEDENVCARNSKHKGRLLQCNRCSSHFCENCCMK